MERKLACTNCGAAVSSLLDQVLDLTALTICQCSCGEVTVILKTRMNGAGPQLRR